MNYNGKSMHQENPHQRVQCQREYKARGHWTLIWEVVFWTPTNCDSHKLRQIRKLNRRILWICCHVVSKWAQSHWKHALCIWKSTPVDICICDFVTICHQGRDLVNCVQSDGECVLCTWDSTHLHFWHEDQKLSFCPSWCYLTDTYTLRQK